MLDTAPSVDSVGRLTQLIVADQQQLKQRRQVKVKTCADVYDQWRQYKRLYRKAPKDGIEFEMEYIDTSLNFSDEMRAKAPLALALHGAPGSYQDFALLISHLSQQNVRVIAPNFPEYVATIRTKRLFRHSANEKAAYLRDFLRAINVNKIDILISHSSAIFPTLLILLNANNEAIAAQKAIKSSATINAHNRETNVQSGDNSHSRPTEMLASLEGESDNKNDEEMYHDNNDDDSLFKDAEAEFSQDSMVKEELTKEQQSDDENVYLKNRNRTNGLKKIYKRNSLRHEEVSVKFDEPIEIKAVALFNPTGHRLPMSMKPTWFKCGFVPFYQNKMYRSFSRKFGPAFLTVIGVPVRVDNMDNVMLSATVMRNSGCRRVEKQLRQLSEMKLPTLMVFSENDKLIEKEISYEMTQFMNLDPKSFDIFNSDGDIELKQSQPEDWIRVMVFKAGGHYAYSNYANTVNEAVSQLLRKVIQTDKKSKGN